MASPSAPKQSSRWGGFLQQAVASVESRLDTILADEDDRAPNVVAPSGKQAEQHPSKAATTSSIQGRTDLSRSSSTARTNDRLQERLARAMAKKDGIVRSTSSAGSTAPPSRAVTPSSVHESERRSSEEQPLANSIPAEIRVTEAPTGEKGDAVETVEVKAEISPALVFTPADQDSGTASLGSTPLRESLDDSRAELLAAEREEPLSGQQDINDMTSKDYEKTMAELRAEHEASELRWQAELHDYVERIDALQSKVLYLAKEAAESAEQALMTVQTGSAERKLLEKDERIALLLEEGQRLSKTELKHMTTIKKLRTQAAENLKAQAELKKHAAKVERDLTTTEEKYRRAQAAEKRSSQRLQSTTKAEQDYSAVAGERDALKETVADMKAQLARAIARADSAEERAQSGALEHERELVAELKDDLTSAKIERELSEEKLRREIRDSRESVEREKEKSKVLEIELRGEQAMLESQLESLRSRAEEVSSSATGDAQAQLLRQIETLQTQYAVASENWQGIEGSLLSRLANVERERDETARREGDVRRKLREATVKARNLEVELESSQDACQELERKLAEQQEKLERLVRKGKQTESELLAVNKDLAREQEKAEETIAHRLEEERAKWRELISPSLNRPPSRHESPVQSLRKSSGIDLLNLSATGSDRPLNRRPSAFAMQGSNTPPRQDSSSSISQQPANGLPLETPSIHAIENDEFFSNGLPTPASPAQTHRGINDLISVSTVGAGPSVQLVERMSATVRRLESERAASKDELARLTAQRDEARNEVVALMREVELKRAADEKITQLEVQSKEMDERYQTTLEMLGEKSEQVEELRADVADVKQMYRDLVDSTMK